MFLSLSLRLLVNAEALNMVESVGNLSRHRTMPIVVKQDDGQYVIRYVPAVSGETIAHEYQSIIVDLAPKYGLPVGTLTAAKEFIKYADDSYLEGIEPPKDQRDARRFEVDVLLHDVVADIGGFLYAGKTPVRRTSRFQASYMIPALDSSHAVGLESQFHVRMALSQVEKEEKTGQARPMIPYNVEVGSALYTLTFNLDIDSIAVPSTPLLDEKGMPIPKGKIKREEELMKQRIPRIKLAIDALTLLFTNLSFGAKKSRFHPVTDVRSAVITLSRISDFVTSPGNYRTHVRNSVERAKKMTEALSRHGIEEKVSIFAVTKEDENIAEETCDNVTLKLGNSLEEALLEVVKLVDQEMSG